MRILFDSLGWFFPLCSNLSLLWFVLCISCILYRIGYVLSHRLQLRPAIYREVLIFVEEHWYKWKARNASRNDDVSMVSFKNIGYPGNSRTTAEQIFKWEKSNWNRYTLFVVQLFSMHLLWSTLQDKLLWLI